MSPSVEPFNEVKYKALMDGLECSEILLSEIPRWNPSLRFDAEFFNKEAITIENRIRMGSHYYLDKAQVVSGPFGSTLKSDSYLVSGDVPFIRIENIRGGFYINQSGIVFISNYDNDRIKNSELQLDDIVLSKVGNTIGFFARVDERLSICNISENNIGIKMSNYPKPQRKYILTYLNSQYAQKMVQRRTSGNAQPKLNVGDVCLIPIPTVSDKFHGAISNLIDKSEDAIVRAEEGYKEAERILATVIDVQSISQTSLVKAEKYLSDSFGKTDRLDAEYYQPKYDTLFEALANVNTKKLGGIDGIVSIMKSLEPGSDVYVDEGIPFVRVSDVSKFEITDPEIKLDSKAISSPDKLFPKKDTILFSKDGSVGIAYKVDADMKVITSGALLHLTVRDTSEVLPDYLTLVLNSPAVQLQAERDSNGAIIQHWKPSEIENVVVPVLDMEIQKEIATKVQDSFALRKKSKQLLEYAKQAVEMAIEQGEDIALEWLKDKVN